MREYSMRRDCFEKATEKVRGLNEKFNPKGVVFANNWMSDMMPAEIIAMRGLNMKTDTRLTKLAIDLDDEISDVDDDVETPDVDDDDETPDEDDDDETPDVDDDDETPDEDDDDETPDVDDDDETPDEDDLESDGDGRRRRRLWALTDALDWRDAGIVGPVKNQGGCGSCWAFAATTTMEAVWALKNNEAPQRMSEQQLVDCDPTSYGC